MSCKTSKREAKTELNGTELFLSNSLFMYNEKIHVLSWFMHMYDVLYGVNSCCTATARQCHRLHATDIANHLAWKLNRTTDRQKKALQKQTRKYFSSYASLQLHGFCNFVIKLWRIKRFHLSMFYIVYTWSAETVPAQHGQHSLYASLIMCGDSFRFMAQSKFDSSDGADSSDFVLWEMKLLWFRSSESGTGCFVSDKEFMLHKMEFMDGM